MHQDDINILLAEYLKKEYIKYYDTKIDFDFAADVDERTIRRILKAEQNISMRILIGIRNTIHKKPSEILKELGF